MIECCAYFRFQTEVGLHSIFTQVHNYYVAGLSEGSEWIHVVTEKLNCREKTKGQVRTKMASAEYSTHF